MKTKHTLVLFILLISIFIPSTSALADGIIIPDPPICDPAPCPPWPRPMEQLVIRYHHVEVTIEDQVATTHVDQIFYNPNDWAIEGIYVFPIPVGAAVSDFVLWIDGQPVEGEVLDAEQARQTYEEIVRQIADPALLEYADRGALRARIFPIAPGEERRIELEYSEVLPAENGLVRYLYPLNTEKFSALPLEDVRISVDVQSNIPIRAAYSPSHSVAVSRESDFHITAGYEATNVLPDTDFAFYYSIGESEAFHLLSFRDPNDPADPDGFFLALLAPRPDMQTDPIPKDVILVLDRSGSMEGEKFSQAQDALGYVLRHINPDDHFNAIAFSTGLESFADQLQPADQADEALKWVDTLSAVGSTDINRALLEAVALTDNERPTYLIFLTDGLPTEGVVESDQILINFSDAPANLRLFAFGVGYDVDTFLLDSLVQEHHGTSTYVLPGEPLDEIISTFYEKISTPVLTNLELDFGEVSVFDVYPNPLPDLFLGSQIVAVGRYREGGTTDVSLTGIVDAESQTFTFPDQIFATESEANSSLSVIPRLWATRKIGYLLNQIRLQGPEEELIDQIVHLSIRYGIVTPYTSYLVTEEMPLGAAEQNRIADDAYADILSAPAEPSFGQEAVEKAAGQGALEGAESVAPPSVEIANVVKIVGPRTFVFTNQQWVDTAFDPDTMQTVQVAFLSDDYFDLVAARSDLAAAFALGQEVIALSEGIAYEVVAADSPVAPIEIPVEKDQQEFGEPSEPEFQPQESAPIPEAKPEVHPEVEESNDANGLTCLGGLLPLALFPLLGLVFRKRL
jgi:Ca-activated chloride channel family protein